MDRLSPTQKKFLFALLYFCEEAPIGFIWWALPTQLRAADVPIERITLLTSILVLPWAFKFLWAPVVDSLRNERWNLRSWIIASQMVMAISLVPLLLFDFAADFQFIMIALLLHTFSAATQDVAIDALCISTIPPEHHGIFNGWMQVGMLAGRSLFGGVALMVAASVGMPWVIGAMIGLLLFVTIVISLVDISASNGSSSIHDTFQRIKSLLWQRSTWYGLGFAVIGGTAYEGVGSVAGPFFVDRGISSESIGLFFSLFSVTAMMAGALLGGTLSDRIGKNRSAVLSTLFVVLIVGSISALDAFLSYRSSEVLFAVFSLLYFGIGLFTSSSYALFMSATDPNLGATQFSAFMGGTNLCESFAALSAGMLIARYDYAAAFSVLAFISLLSLPLILRIQSHHHSGVNYEPY
jgi:MFS family permease